MSAGWIMQTPRNASQFMALVALLALPLEVHAQRTKVIVAPPTGWFGVRISDEATIDPGGNAFFDSYPIVTGVDSSSPAATSDQGALDRGQHPQQGRRILAAERDEIAARQDCDRHRGCAQHDRALVRLPVGPANCPSRALPKP